MEARTWGGQAPLKLRKAELAPTATAHVGQLTWEAKAN